MYYNWTFCIFCNLMFEFYFYLKPYFLIHAEFHAAKFQLYAHSHDYNVKHIMIIFLYLEFVAEY